MNSGEFHDDENRVRGAARHLAAAIVAIPGRDNKNLQRLLPTDHAVVGRVNGNGDALKIGVNALIHYESDLEIQK